MNAKTKHTVLTAVLVLAFVAVVAWIYKTTKSPKHKDQFLYTTSGTSSGGLVGFKKP